MPGQYLAFLEDEDFASLLCNFKTVKAGDISPGANEILHFSAANVNDRQVQQLAMSFDKLAPNQPNFIHFSSQNGISSTAKYANLAFQNDTNLSSQSSFTSDSPSIVDSSMNGELSLENEPDTTGNSQMVETTFELPNSVIGTSQTRSISG